MFHAGELLFVAFNHCVFDAAAFSIASKEWSRCCSGMKNDDFLAADNFDRKP